MSVVSKVGLAALLYASTALLPPHPLEKPLFLIELAGAPAPERVAVPVDGVSIGQLRDSWGGARPGGRTHQGIDIFAPRGTPVRASTDGVVSRVGEDGLGGHVVWVLGPGRQMHYYAHLDRFADVHAGDIVRAGRLLGYVGTTGNARGTPPHLHYGIYERGAIDPYPLLVGPERARKAGRG